MLVTILHGTLVFLHMTGLETLKRSHNKLDGRCCLELSLSGIQKIGYCDLRHQSNLLFDVAEICNSMVFSADGNYQVTIMTKAKLTYNGSVEWAPPAVYKRQIL